MCSESGKWLTFLLKPNQFSSSRTNCPPQSLLSENLTHRVCIFCGWPGISILIICGWWGISTLGNEIEYDESPSSTIRSLFPFLSYSNLKSLATLVLSSMFVLNIVTTLIILNLYVIRLNVYNLNKVMWASSRSPICRVTTTLLNNALTLHGLKWSTKGHKSNALWKFSS